MQVKKSEYISDKKWKLCMYTENQLNDTEILRLLSTSAACQRISTFLFFLACTFCPRNLNSSGRHVWLRDRGRPTIQTKPSPLFLVAFNTFTKISCMKSTPICPLEIQSRFLQTIKAHNSILNYTIPPKNKFKFNKTLLEISIHVI